MRTVWSWLCPLLLLSCEERPPDPNPDALPLAEAITLQSGVYNPWTDRCSSADGPVHRDMYVRRPAGPGPWPVFLYLPGTVRAADNASARAIVDRAAGRGFVAASVDYDSLASVPNGGPCDSAKAKAHCTFSVDAPDAPEAALSLLCNDTTLDGGPAGLDTDCSLGVLVAGFSQGATIAMRAANVHDDVRAGWFMGFHDQGLRILDPEPFACVHTDQGTPPGDRALPGDASRIIIGEDDAMLTGPHQEHLENTTGRQCADGAEQCFDEDGSGWGIVPNGACGGSCEHEYLDHPGFYEPGTWWGVEANLDWLTEFVP